MSLLNGVRALACATLLATAAPTSAAEDVKSVRVLQESLVAWAASDFIEHGPRPRQVRNVHVRYAVNDSGERSYMLCGQFLPDTGSDPGWLQFSTIKTDPYEQWIGGQAEGICERATPLSEGVEDLSSALQLKLSENATSTSEP